MRLRVGGGLRHRDLPVDRGRRVGAPDPARGPHAGLRIRLAGVRHSRAEPAAPAFLSRGGHPVTGYLTQLAARSLSPGDTVRPRVAGMFEPAGPADVYP